MEKLKNNVKQPLVSIIIPVYCVEKYIQKCVESVRNSTYANIEIILVDDGSTDSSGMICDELASQDDRIIVIHSDNYGQSHARNLGLDIAKGTYIGFVDSDDWVHSDMYSEMIKIAVSQNADIVECNFNGRRKSVPDAMDENIQIKMTGMEAIRRQLDYRMNSRFPSTSVWSKIFRSEILRYIRFPDGRIHEEYCFLCQAFCKAQNYIYINKSLYEHVIREGSTTSDRFSVKSIDKFYVYQDRNKYLRKLGNEELYILSKEQEYDLLIFLAGEAAKAYLFEEEKKIREEIIHQKDDIMRSNISRSKKGQYKLFFFSHLFYYGIRNGKMILRHPREFLIKNIQKEFTVKNILGIGHKERYYVIRCNQPNCGMFAIFMYVLDHIAYAKDNGYIPVLEMEKYECLYKEKEKVNGTYDPWQYYFLPVTEVTWKQKWKAHSITYGKMGFLRYKGIYYFAQKWKNILPEKERIAELHNLVEQYIRFRPELQQELESRYREITERYHRILGIHVRGTDMYVAGKQHNKPSSKLVDFSLVREIVEKNNIDGIFLCTDDKGVVAKFKKNFEDTVFVTDSIRQEDGKMEGVHFDQTLGKGRQLHKYLLGKEVITDMYILSKCNVLMCGPSNVAYAAIIYNNCSYEDVIFCV